MTSDQSNGAPVKKQDSGRLEDSAFPLGNHTSGDHCHSPTRAGGAQDPAQPQDCTAELIQVLQRLHAAQGSNPSKSKQKGLFWQLLDAELCGPEMDQARPGTLTIISLQAPVES